MNPRTLLQHLDTKKALTRPALLQWRHMGCGGFECQLELRQACLFHFMLPLMYVEGRVLIQLLKRQGRASSSSRSSLERSYSYWNDGYTMQRLSKIPDNEEMMDPDLLKSRH